jgi:hypothetical protein
MKTFLRIITCPFKWVALEIFAAVFLLLIGLDYFGLMPSWLDKRLAKHFEVTP